MQNYISIKKNKQNSVLIFGDGAITYGLLVEQFNKYLPKFKLYIVCRHRRKIKFLINEANEKIFIKNIFLIDENDSLKVYEAITSCKYIFIVDNGKENDLITVNKFLSKNLFNKYRAVKEKTTLILVSNNYQIKSKFIYWFNKYFHQAHVDLATVAEIIISLPDRICCLSDNVIYIESACKWSIEKSHSLNLPFLFQVENIRLEMDIKAIFFNYPHAFCAWLGAIYGYTKMSEAISDNSIKDCIMRLYNQEIFAITKKKYQLKEPFLIEKINHFFQRLCICTFDEVFRVGRDPLRKMSIGSGLYELKRTAHRSKKDAYIPVIDFSIALAILYGYIFTPFFKGNDIHELISKEFSFDDSILFKAKLNIEAIAHIVRRKICIGRAFKIPLFRMINNRLDFYPLSAHTHIIEKLKRIGLKLELSTGRIFYEKKFTPLKLKANLIFVRHGETYGNRGLVYKNSEINFNAQSNTTNRIFQGNVDTSCNQLTMKGRYQSRATAAAIKVFCKRNHIIPDIIYYSPLGRAKATCEPFANLFTNTPSIPFLLAKEMDFGYFENRRICDLSSDNPFHSFYLQQNSLIKFSGIGNDGYFHEGESFCDLLLRIIGLIQFINKKHENENVVLFSHSMVWSALLILLGKGVTLDESHYLCFDANQLPNASKCHIGHAQAFFINSEGQTVSVKD
jgi:broad specificity phosphatase PhoE